MTLDVSDAINRMTGGSGETVKSDSPCAAGSATTDAFLTYSWLDKACMLASITDTVKILYVPATNTITWGPSTPAPALLKALSDTVKTAYDVLALPQAKASDMLPVILALCRTMFVYTCSAGDTSKDAAKIRFFEEQHVNVRTAAATVFASRKKADLASFEGAWLSLWRGSLCDALPSLDLMAAQLKLDETQQAQRTQIMSAILFNTHRPYFLYSWYIANLTSRKADFYVLRCSTLASWLMFAHIYEYCIDQLPAADDKEYVTARFNDIISLANDAIKPDDPDNTTAMSDAKQQSSDANGILKGMRSTDQLLRTQQNKLVMMDRRLQAARAARKANLVALIVWGILTAVTVSALIGIATKGSNFPVIAVGLCIAVIAAVVVVWVRQRSILPNTAS